MSTQRLKPKAGVENNYNVVLVIQESMGTEPLSIYGYNNNYMPFFKDWVDEEHERIIIFEDAMAISGCTDISLPSIVTGAGAEEGYDKLLKAPFIWDYYKANGYKTAYISSQRYKWKKFNEFFNNKNLDHLYSAESSGFKIVNDAGVDDFLISKYARGFVNRSSIQSPLLLIYNTNALHVPYQDESEVKIPESIDNRYGKALYIIDKSLEQLIKAFQETERMDNTIFIFTSDHGQFSANRVQRLGSFLKETLSIPIIIRFPNSWISNHKEKFEKIMENKSSRISNLDLVPTMIDLIGSTQINDSIVNTYKGTSLFESISNERLITCLSTNDTRKWEYEGFGLYKDSLSYILDDINHEQLYDLIHDKNQMNNIIEDGPKEYLERSIEYVRSNKFLNRIYDEYLEDKK